MKRWNPSRAITVALAAALMAGCTDGGDGYRELGEQDDVVNTSPPEEHHHHHAEGPHGGHLLEFDAFHGELVMDASRRVTLYLLGEDAKTPAPAENASVVLGLQEGDQQQEVPLKAQPLESEHEGTSSRFVAEAEAIPESIKDIEDLQGSVTLTVGEKTSTAHISHDHDHEHHDDEHAEN